MGYKLVGGVGVLIHGVGLATRDAAWDLFQAWDRLPAWDRFPMPPEVGSQAGCPALPDLHVKSRARADVFFFIVEGQTDRALSRKPSSRRAKYYECG